MSISFKFRQFKIMISQASELKANERKKEKKERVILLSESLFKEGKRGDRLMHEVPNFSENISFFLLNFNEI